MTRHIDTAKQIEIANTINETAVALTGSEKQVSWANAIRFAAIQTLEVTYAETVEESTDEAMKSTIRATIDGAYRIDNAKWWIDNVRGAEKNARMIFAALTK